MTTKIQQIIQSRPWIAFVDDERDLDHGFIVTLEDGYFFKADHGCGVCGFDSWSEVKDQTKKSNVYCVDKAEK